jgi:hypothetical protein
MTANRGLAAVAEAALSTTSPAALATAALAAAAPAMTTDAATVDHTAALAASRAAVKAEGAKEGATAERARIKAIVSSDPAKNRQALAHSLAFNTDLSVEAAIAVLGDSPEVKASRLDGLVPSPKVAATEAPAEGDRAPLVSGLAAATQAEFKRRNPGAAASK